MNATAEPRMGLENQPPRLRLLVMGAGAIGSVIGGLLAKCGHEVWLCGREPHIEAIRDDGLCICGIWGEHLIKMPHLVTSPEQIPRGTIFDSIFLTVKSFDTLDATRQVSPLIGPETLIVSLQNGLGNVEEIATIAGKERTVAGRVIFGAQINRPGVAEVTVYAEEVMLGSPFGMERLNSRIEQLAAQLNAAGIPSKPTNQIQQYLWSKLLYNACLNPMCTLLQCPYGYLLEKEGTREQMRAIIHEIYAVAAARRILLAHPTPDDYQRVLFERLIPSTYAHYPSMWQDIQRERRTEIDAINGRVVEYGRESGTPTPVNAALTSLIKALEIRAISKNA